jgi:hypothetical protein
MPTTATVAPPRAYTGDEIATGLRIVADLIETHPWIAAHVRFPNAPQVINLGLTERADIDALATLFGESVRVIGHGDRSMISTTCTFAGVTLSAYAVVESTRLLHRDPDATTELAERDA